MKLSSSGVTLLAFAFLGTALGVDTGTTDEKTICDRATKQSECPAVSGCVWEKDPNNNYHCIGAHEHTDCAARAANQCEDDDLCFLENIKGVKTCKEVNLGHAIEGEWCQSYYSPDDEGGVYLEVPNHGCHEGFICTVGNQTDPNSTAPINGTCVPTSCNGKKVPGNCNGNAVKEQCNATTQRVTICHRTCSEKNPWVRITIDEDAWSGQGCGHQLQHNVTQECKNKAPWTAWGPNRTDYLIKFHGTRDHVKTINKFNTAQEKAYWRYWEPACPYVRQDKCCDWAKGNCCGIQTLPTYTPKVQVKKYAGPPDLCKKGSINQLQDVLYTLPKFDSAWQYCYVVTVPSDSECLYNMEITDSAPIGGIGAGVDITTPVANKDFNSLHLADSMCPGDVKYIPGPKIPDGIEDPEKGYNVCVVGTGIMSGKDVTACDAAGVEPPPCLISMGNTDEDLCPGYDTVSTMSFKVADGIIPAKFDPSSMFYGMKFADDAGSVTFKVDSPFKFPVDMFVQYHKKAAGSVNGGLDPVCVDKLAEPGCNEQATEFTAGCIHPEGKAAYTLVSVFFISENSLFSDGGTDVVPYECCPIPAADKTKPIIEYSFKILCECPDEAETSARLLSDSDFVQLWEETVGTGH